MDLQKKVREKTALICGEFYRFAAIGGYTDVRINPIAVKSAVKSWADDAARHGGYHGSALGPRKHLALLAYWLVKIKPVFLPLCGESYAEPKYSASKYKAVNERFALYLVFGILRVLPKTDIREKFVYLFYFRDINPKHLFLTLELLCNSEPEYLVRNWRPADTSLVDGMG
jgi:hypothetical protein